MLWCLHRRLDLHNRMMTNKIPANNLNFLWQVTEKMKMLCIFVPLMRLSLPPFEQGVLCFHFVPDPTNYLAGHTMLQGEGWTSRTVESLACLPPSWLLWLVEMMRACHSLGSFSLLGGVIIFKGPASRPPTGPLPPGAVLRRGPQLSHSRVQPWDLSLPTDPREGAV